MKPYHFLIVGGDLRQRYLYESLAKKGQKVDLLYHDVMPTAEEAAERISTAKVLIFPVPTTQDQHHLFSPTLKERVALENITRFISENAIVFTGGECAALSVCKTRKTVNLLADESMTMKNAMATAEAAVSILINKTDHTLFDANALILGYGRIAQLLTNYLNALHAHVCVCARRDDARTAAKLSGCTAVGFDELERALRTADVVINTIPAVVLGKNELLQIKENALILDLASKPGGIDWGSAERFGLHPIQALSLPGKFSPKSAAKYMEECIYSTFV